MAQTVQGNSSEQRGLLFVLQSIVLSLAIFSIAHRMHSKYRNVRCISCGLHSLCVRLGNSLQKLLQNTQHIRDQYKDLNLLKITVLCPFCVIHETMTLTEWKLQNDFSHDVDCKFHMDSETTLNNSWLLCGQHLRCYPHVPITSTCPWGPIHVRVIANKR